MKARRLLAVIVATTIILQASALRASAQTPNIVIQWNQTLQTLFVGTGPGIHLRALPMMHIAMFDAINSIEDAYTPYLVRGEGFPWRVCRSGGGYCGERRAGGSLPCADGHVRHPALDAIGRDAARTRPAR